MINGLYSLRLEMLDGIPGKAGGVMILRDGIIRGGDTYFYYLGSYTFAEGKWKGELTTEEHTPSRGQRPLLGGRLVGIGFSGTYNDMGAEAFATALAGSRSIRFRATMTLLVPV